MRRSSGSGGSFLAHPRTPPARRLSENRQGTGSPDAELIGYQREHAERGSADSRGEGGRGLGSRYLESAKLAGVDPARYLAEATRRAIASPGTVTLPRDLVGA